MTDDGENVGTGYQFVNSVSPLLPKGYVLNFFMIFLTLINEHEMSAK